MGEGLNDQAIDAIQIIAGKSMDIECTVKSVNLNNLTCVCDPIEEGDLEYNNVRIVASRNSDTYFIPTIGSNVIIRKLSSNGVAYVALFSDIDTINLNGDNEGGICKADKVIDALLDLKKAMSNAVVVASDGGASLKSTFLASLITFTEQTLQSIKNDKVKHGSN